MRISGVSVLKLWTQRCGTALALLMWSSVAWADEDDVPMDPAVLIPGLKVFLVIAALGIAAIVWYRLRKRAILRAHSQDQVER